MSVTSYIPSLVCGYKYSKLKNVVYLVSKSHVKEVRIDDGEAYVLNLVETPMRIDCHSVEFTENESLDERYKFSKSLKFTVDGYANVQSLEGGCYAIIITYDGVPYMVNIDFPAKATYTFTLSDKQNQTEFTLSSTSNYPTLRLQGNLDTANTFVCKPYREYGIEQLELIEKNYVTINDQTATVTTIGGRTFKEIDFNRHSCTLQETFDGEACTDVITFDIGFDAYKPSWQYNLLEFTDNLYAAMVTPKSSSNKFFVGFNFGLDPQYVIDSTTSEGNSDKITITLSEKSVHGMITLENPRIIDDDDTYWQYVDYVYDYETYECIDNGVAKYLAMQELDSLNNPTGNYKVLRGYRDRYEGKFNIIGEFDEVVTFFTTKCSWFNPCTFTGLPSIITFIGTVCHTYTVYGSCDWHFENMPSYLTYSRTSGLAGETYTLQICNKLATDVTVTGSFDVIYGDKTDTIDVQIITGDMKLQAYYNNQTRYQLPCNGTTALTQSEVRAFDQATIGQMTEAIIGTCIDRIDDYAFLGTSALTAVTIPEGIRYIDNGAFYGDGKLLSIDLPDSLYEIGRYAFYGNSGATSLDLGNGVERIGGYAFQNCYKIPRIYIPNSVNYMGDYTFYANSGATSLHLSENSSMTEVLNHSFRYCTSLPSVVIPDNYTEVGSFAFADCSAMTSVTLSENMAILRNSAFEYNPSLRSIELPQSLQRIEQGCFRLNTALTSVTIPSDVNFIGDNAFSGDTALQWVLCEPMTPPSGGSAMFDVTNNCPIYVHCEALPRYQVAPYWTNYRKRLRSIEDDCPIKLHTTYTDDTEFDVYCNSSSTLTSNEVAMGGSKGIIKEAVVGTCNEIIGENAFRDADALTAVTLPNTIKKIDNYGFYSCDILPNITLPCADYPPPPPSRLPEGYTEIGYVQNTNTSTSTYAQTNYYPTNNTKVIGDFKCDNTSKNPRLFGSGNYQSLAYILDIEDTSPRKYYYKFGDTSGWYTTSKSADTDRHVYTMSKDGIYVDSELISTPPTTSFTCTYPLTIFNSVGAGVTISENYVGKCYSFKIYENNTLVRDYVPCVRDYDGKVGFYDIVGNNGYVTSVSGNLTGDTEQPVNGLELGNYAFAYCRAFTHITLPDCLKKVGTHTFEYNTSVTGITFGSGLTYISDYMFYHNEALPTVTIPSHINSIGQFAFAHGYALTSATISDGVNTIGGGAFNTCNQLTGITIPNSVTYLGSESFENCTSLRYANIGTGVTYINAGTFRNDSSLTSVTMSNNVTGITEQAFQSCTSLASIDLPDNLVTLGNAVFRYDSALTSCTIPATVTSMGKELFNHCTSLQYVWMNPIVPPTLASSNAFDDTQNCPIYVPCQSLAAYQTAPQWSNVRERLVGYGDDCPVKYKHGYTNYRDFTMFCDAYNYMTSADTKTRPKIAYNEMTYTQIGECVQSLSANTYSGCSLQTVEFLGDNTLYKMGNNAFKDCAYLRSIQIPNSVNYIGSYCFANDTSLTAATLPTGITYVNTSMFENCTALPSIVIPNNVTELYTTAFRNDTSLTSITLSNRLTRTGFYCFEHDHALTGITLPNTFRTFDTGSFKDCTSLTAVTIPSGVTSIGSETFSGDTSLEYIICEPLTPPSLGNINAFASDDDYPIYVHCSALGVYQRATNWKTIKYRLRPIETPCEPKLHTEYEDGSTNDVYCDNNSNLPQSDVRNDAPSYSIMIEANIGECVNSIGNNAFQDCVLLEEATMHNTITSIGSNAFRNCNSMSSITMSNNVVSIGENAFYECTSLSGITLPNTLTTIGNNAFHHCANIVGRVNVPNSVTSFGSGVFSNCYHIDSVTLPNTLTRIPENSFQACLALSSVTIPSTVTEIGKSAFEACIRLTGVTLPSGLKTIGANAFEDCERLQSIRIPQSVTNIGTQAFYYCSGLTEIYMEGDKPPVLSGESVFDFTNDCPIYVPCMASYSIAKGWTEYVGRMIEYGGGCSFAMQSHYSDNTNYSVFCYDLPNGVLGTSQTRAHTTSYTAMTRTNIMDCTTTIGDNAFDGCRSLTSVTIPSSVSSINQYAFRNCNQISSITLPNSITNIGSSAFSGCSSMTSLTIPANVSDIGSSAFRNCTSLQGIYPQSATAPTIGSNALDNTNNCPIYLPTCDSATSYWTKWSSYKSRFVLPSDCPTGVTVDLNSQWSGSTSYGNLSSASTEYYFYESFSNWHVQGASATTYLTVTNTPIDFYVRSYAEGSYDYVVVKLDGNQIASTSNKQSPTNWTKVSTNDTMIGTHVIEIIYKKDSSYDANDDRGYLALPKRYICENQEERWIGTGEMKCIGGELHEIEKKQWRCVGDTQWIDAGETRTGTTSHGECTYTNLDWLERNSSHTARLPLGLSLKDNTMFKIGVIPLNNGGSGIVGESISEPDNDDYRIFWSNNNIYYDYGSSRMNTSCYTGNTYNLEVGNYYVKNIDSSSYILQGTAKSGTATSHDRPLSLFGNDYARIYYLQVYEGSTLVEDLIPVRDGNGVVTMLDRVSGTIMTPEGGTFKGSDE